MIQVVKYKCCGKIFAACCEPDCYTDNNWTKNLKKYVNIGHKVEFLKQGQSFSFGACNCKTVTQPKLF